MEWLNYHHLRYFFEVAREGSLAKAAAKLRVSQPSISEQIHELEGSLGEKLFRREGRINRLTDAGQIVLGFAEQIFTLGSEMLNAVKQRPGALLLRLSVGVVDSFPKLVTSELLKPVFSMPQPVHVICREGKMEELLPQLAAHRLDILLSDEPPSSSFPFKTFDHMLGACGTVFCAERKLARRLREGFPKTLHLAPALLPADNSRFRRALEVWFRAARVQPTVVAEFDDLALMKAMAAEGRGFIALPELVANEAVERYAFGEIGRAPRCSVEFHAISAERRIAHPAVAVLTEAAQRDFHARHAGRGKPVRN